MVLSKSLIWQSILAVLVALASWIGSGVHASAAEQPDSAAAPQVVEVQAR